MLVMFFLQILQIKHRQDWLVVGDEELLELVQLVSSLQGVHGDSLFDILSVLLEFDKVYEVDGNVERFFLVNEGDSLAGSQWGVRR